MKAVPGIVAPFLVGVLTKNVTFDPFYLYYTNVENYNYLHGLH
jgi:hypothetical protein